MSSAESLATEETSVGRLPQGFSFAGVHCGLKEGGKLDLALVAADRSCVAAGVYTQNTVVAAPVLFDRARTPSAAIRCIVINAGNANACTGEQGERDAAEMARLAAAACGAPADSALVLSTGVIGRHLPMDCVRTGIHSAGQALSADGESLEAAARAMMTTDTFPKIASRTLAGGASVLGIAKGAAMIGPNMATMLAVVATDAKLDGAAAEATLRDAAAKSFNRISVEGHTSTNDTVLLLASGAVESDDAEEVSNAVHEVCRELALRIVDDAEGATHRIRVLVAGAASDDAADRIARTVAGSNLVKTAVHGADPNWGRIVSAAGYAGVRFSPDTAALRINGVSVFSAGAPVAFDEASLASSIAANRDCVIELDCGAGAGAAEHWTADLTAEYVRLNADYTT